MMLLAVVIGFTSDLPFHYGVWRYILTLEQQQLTCMLVMARHLTTILVYILAHTFLALCSAGFYLRGLASDRV